MILISTAKNHMTGRAVFSAPQGLGCCGIGALYDNEAKDLLGLDDTSALLYLVAAGTIRNS